MTINCLKWVFKLFLINLMDMLKNLISLISSLTWFLFLHKSEFLTYIVFILPKVLIFQHFFQGRSNTTEFPQILFYCCYCLSWKLFVFPLYLIDYFTGYITLGWYTFIVIFYIFDSTLLLFDLCDKMSDVLLFFVPL